MLELKGAIFHRMWVSAISLFFSRTRDSTTCRVGRSIRPSVTPSVTSLTCQRFSHYCSCPTVRDWVAVYLALLNIVRPLNVFNVPKIFPCLCNLDIRYMVVCGGAVWGCWNTWIVPDVLYFISFWAPFLSPPQN